jgi:hypothetical protein
LITFEVDGDECDNLVGRLKCTIHDWCPLYEPLNQFGDPNFSKLNIVKKMGDVLQNVTSNFIGFQCHL